MVSATTSTIIGRHEKALKVAQQAVPVLYVSCGVFMALLPTNVQQHVVMIACFCLELFRDPVLSIVGVSYRDHYQPYWAEVFYDAPRFLYHSISGGVSLSLALSDLLSLCMLPGSLLYWPISTRRSSRTISEERWSNTPPSNRHACSSGTPSRFLRQAIVTDDETAHDCSLAVT